MAEVAVAASAAAAAAAEINEGYQHTTKGIAMPCGTIEPRHSPAELVSQQAMKP